MVKDPKAIQVVEGKEEMWKQDSRSGTRLAMETGERPQVAKGDRPPSECTGDFFHPLEIHIERLSHDSWKLTMTEAL